MIGRAHYFPKSVDSASCTHCMFVKSVSNTVLYLLFFINCRYVAETLVSGTIPSQIGLLTDLRVLYVCFPWF